MSSETEILTGRENSKKKKRVVVKKKRTEEAIIARKAARAEAKAEAMKVVVETQPQKKKKKRVVRTRPKTAILESRNPITDPGNDSGDNQEEKELEHKPELPALHPTIAVVEEPKPTTEIFQPVAMTPVSKQRARCIIQSDPVSPKLPAMSGILTPEPRYKSTIHQTIRGPHLRKAAVSIGKRQMVFKNKLEGKNVSFPARSDLIAGPQEIRARFLVYPSEDSEGKLSPANYDPKDSVFIAQTEVISEADMVPVAFSSLTGLAHINKILRKPRCESTTVRTVPHAKPLSVRFI